MTSSSRTILLTGATAGVGRALVDRFAEAGHVVLGCGRRADAIAELVSRHPAPHAFASVDVSDAAAVDAWAAELLAAGHVPDLVLNNAAIMNRQVPVWEVGADEMERMLAVNIGGVANVVRSFVPAMIEAGRGVVVNLSSGWGHSTSPHVGPYCATKHAVEGLSGSLSQELPSGLACVALSPGVIDTDMLRTCLPDVARETDGAEAWSRRNADYLLSLGPQHNGQSLSVS